MKFPKVGKGSGRQEVLSSLELKNDYWGLMRPTER